MHGPPLSPHEVAAVLRGNVERFVALGIPRETAIEAVARDHGLAPARVEGIIERYYPTGVPIPVMSHG